MILNYSQTKSLDNLIGEVISKTVEIADDLELLGDEDLENTREAETEALAFHIFQAQEALNNFLNLWRKYSGINGA